MGKNKKKGRGGKIVVAVIVVAIIAIGTAFKLRKGDEVITVQTDKVTRRDITEVVVANGRIQPVVQVVINPEVSGEIIGLPVKEGQTVKKGDVLVRIKPDNYIASRNSVEASYRSSLAAQSLAMANLHKAEFEFKRIEELYKNNLVSESQHLEVLTSLEVAKANAESSTHQVEQTKAALARAEDDLSKTTILSPLAGTVTNLRSQQGERVVGTAMMAGTEIMTIADLNKMEARVDIGEIDVVLIQPGQRARLEVEAFREEKFTGTVTEIANAAKGTSGAQQNNQQQEATKFEVKILIREQAQFRPGMSVSAEIETRSRTNALTVPIMAVTARMKKDRPDEKEEGSAPGEAVPLKAPKKEEPAKPDEIVFLVDGDVAKSVIVKTGISDDSNIEITDGLTEGQEIVSGGYAAVSRQLEDGKKIKKGGPEMPPKSVAAKQE